MSPLLLAIAEDEVTAGPIGLLIVGVLGLVTVLLIRNMSKRIKRLPNEFPGQERPDQERPDPPAPEER